MPITPANTLGRITPANDKTSRPSVGVFPYVGDALLGWFLPMQWGIVRSALEDYEETESVKWTNTQGVICPLKEQRIASKPEGQRAWIWKMMHCLPNLQLNLNDIIIDKDQVKYRVLGRSDYSQAGYMYYELVQDYKEYNGH